MKSYNLFSHTAKFSLLTLVLVVSLLGKSPVIVASAAPEPDVKPAPFFAPVASVNLDVPANVMLGENFTFTATFANTSGTPTDVGYGPFIDIVLPANGADGNGNQNPPLDGISFINATYLGAAVTSTVLTFPGSGAANTCVDHPYAVAPVTGAPLQVCGAPGDTLVVLQLPFGSFVPGQPPVVVTITASVSNLADVGTPLTIRARGGYQYGATPTNDWCCVPVDATILSHPNTNSTTWPGSPATPRLFTISKSYDGPEDETATGPNFPHTYTVTVDIANGQTLTNLDVTDTLPNNMQFIAFVGSTPASSDVSTPSTSTPGGVLTRRFASVTGTTGTADATMTFSFYISQFDSGGASVLDPVTGTPATSVNEAQATATWTPLDSRDAATPVNGVCTSPCHTLTDRSIATQKSVAVVTDTSPAGVSPGDVLEYTLAFQVSDFFAFDAVILTDTISDGQRVDVTFIPTLQVDGNGYTLAAAAFDAANYTVDNSQIGNSGPNPPADGTDGSQTIIFHVSDEIVTRGQPDGRLVGGCVDPLNGGGLANCTAGPTTGTIVFHAVIQQNFTDTYPSGDASVDHGDVLDDTLVITGDMLDTSTPAFTPTGSSVTDGSVAGLNIAFGGLTKSVYAINGTVCEPCTSQITSNGINPGDTVTYRLSYTMPASDFEQTVITDYLPLPVFSATEVTTLNNTVCGVPSAGTACLGPNDTFHTLTTPVPSAPTLSTNGTSNTVSFTYAAYDNTSDITSTIDLLFTVTVSNEQFADGLFLTNQANVTEGTTNSTPTAQNAIVQIKLNEPALYTTKAAVSTDNPNGVFTPAVAAPIVFNAPGTVGLSWSGGTINSTYLDANPIDSDLSKVDAGDLIRFAIIIRNDGHSQKGAFDISIIDTLQPGYVIPGSGLNLQIYRGDGLALTYTNVGGGTGIFDQGIKIDDPGAPGVGACQAHDATNGRNVIVITYDLQLDTSITLDQGIINTAALVNYSSTPGGPDFTDPLDITDTATVQPVTAPVKSIVTTSEAHTSEAGTGTTASPRLVAIGEIVRFRIVQGLPEGIVTNFRLHDLLPAGLTFLDDNTARAAFVSDGGGVTSDTLSGAGLNATGDETSVAGITPSFVLPDTAVSENDSIATANYTTDDVDAYASGDDVFFKFGTVNNPDRDINNEYVVVEFNVIVANIAGNNTGTNRDNTAAARYGASTADSNSSAVVRVRVVQPSITFGKTIVALPTPLDAGGVVQYRLSYVNGTGANISTAFDVRLTDPLPAQLGLNLASITVTLAGGASGVTNASAANNLDITVASVPVGGSVVVDYTATIQDTVTPAEIITNTSISTWTSLPGDTGTTPNGTGSTTGPAGSATGERIGTGVSPNTYQSTSSQSFNTASPTVAKQLTATSASHTPASSVAIGEEVTYDILLTFPEGTTPSDTVVDDLPAGLEIVTGTPQVITTAAMSGGVLTDDFNGVIGAQNITTVPGDGGSVQFDFTGVVVAGDNITTNNTLLVRFNARVTNIAANISGATISNAATNQVGAGTPVTTNTVTVTVVEPDITFGKTIVSLPTPLDAGGVVHYQITYANGTGANVSTAMDVNITDALAAELLLPSTGAPDVTITATAGVGAITNNSTTSNINITVASVPPGESVTVDFYPVIQNTITSGQVIDNVGDSTWTSLSGTVTGERTGADGPAGSPDNYAATSTVTFGFVTDPLFSKSIELTSVPGSTNPNTVIGEVVTFGLYATLPEGTTPSLQLVDDLPDGMAYIDNSYVLVTTQPPAACGSLSADFNGTVPAPTVTVAPPTGGDSAVVTFDFGPIQVNGDNDANNNTFLVCFEAVVENLAGNQDGIGLTNNATLQAGSGPVFTDSESVNIVEPVLQITKTVNELFPIPTQVVHFTLAVDHAPASTSDAHDAIVFDDLPSNLSLIVPSVTATPAGGVSGITDVSAGNRVEVRVDTFPVGGSLTVEFDATFTGNLGDQLTNTANVTWTSITGANPDERTSGGGVNDYQASAGIGLANTREIYKSLVLSNHPNTTLPDVAIGEILTYQVVLTLPANSTDTAIVTDTLDLGLAFVDCSDITAGPNVTSSTVDFTATGNCNPGTAATDNPQVQNSGSALRFDFGTIVNANPTDTETITITYRAVVLDVVSNTGGVQLDNVARWQWATASLTASTTPVTVREADLGITKTVDPLVALPGATVTYTLLIEHTADSEADAFDLVVTDAFPAGLEFAGGVPTVTTVGGQAPDTVAYDALTRTLTLQWNTFLRFPVSAQSELEISAQLASTLRWGQTIENTASLEWSSLPGDVSAPQSVFNTASTERRYDPPSPADVYITTSTATLTIPRLPGTGFAPNQITSLPQKPESYNYSVVDGFWLEIPRLNVKMSIVGVPFGQANWDLTWLGSQAGYLNGTAYPTHAGNSGITGHAYLADGTPGPFAKLDQLRYGDQIIVHLGGQRYIFEVRQNKLIAPGDLSVLKHEEYPWLTLITCKSYSETAQDYLYRVSVRAVLVKVEVDK
ncbi:MAG: sortase [Chloroflexi bacterium]|nr:sortase [Chloroflexota bacterium]